MTLVQVQDNYNSFSVVQIFSDHCKIIEPPRDKTNKMTAPNEDSDQPGHPPSLIRVFPVRMKKAWVLSYPLSTQRRLWSDWADAQVDLSLCWTHRVFCLFCRAAAQMSLSLRKSWKAIMSYILFRNAKLQLIKCCLKWHLSLVEAKMQDCIKFQIWNAGNVIIHWLTSVLKKSF